MRRVASVEGIDEYELANGLRVLLFPDPSRPTVTVNLTVLVGARHEGHGESGLAHLLEHMAFKGTPTHPDIPRALGERGAQFNGTTSDDRTNYYETLPASDENLEFAVRLEADRLVHCALRAEDLAAEFPVVLNEFERGENSPWRVLLQRLAATAYDWHNYGRPIIGHRGDIERVSRDALRAFYERYYQPDNALLIVAGRFDEARALDLIARYFAPLPRPARVLTPPRTVEPPRDGERSVVLRRVGDVPLLGAAYHIPAAAHPDFSALSLLSRILTAQPAGRLYRQLVTAGLASSVYGFVSARRDPSLLVVGAEVAREQVPDETLARLLHVTESLAEAPVSTDEVERAQRQWLKEWELQSANTTAIAVALSTWAAQGDWRLYFLARDRVEQLDAVAVQAAAVRYLQRNNRTAGLFLPTQAAERVAIPAAPAVATLVDGYQGRSELARGEAFDVAPRAIERRVLRSGHPHGLRLALLPKKTRGESVTLLLRLRYGDVESLAGRAAAAEMLGDWLLRGAGGRGYQELRDTLDQERMQLGVGSSPGVLTLSLRTRRAHLRTAVPLLLEILRTPRFEYMEFATLRRQQLADIEQSLSDPQSLAATALRRAMTSYGTSDPRYVPTGAEAAARLRELDPDEVRDLHARFLGGGPGELVVVGDFTESELRPLLDGLADWEPGRPYARLSRLVPDELVCERQVITTPDRENAVFLAAGLTRMSSGEADFPALLIANHVLGGSSLSSRLGDRVRRREGMSYGVGSALHSSALDPRTVWQLQAMARPDNIERLEGVIREEVERFWSRGCTTEELEQAQRGFLRQQEVTRAQDERLAGLLADGLYEGRTMEYYVELEARIQALDERAVHSAFQRRFSPHRLLRVAAGDFAAARTVVRPEPTP